MTNRKRPDAYPGRLPRFPLCAAAREGCALLGFHGHRTRCSDEERERVRRWFAWFDEQHPRRSS